MKKITLLLLALVLISSCDDGDFIVTDFNFNSESDLQLCQSGATNVLYVVNKDPSESISFNFSDENFTGIIIGDSLTKTQTVQLSTTNKLVYRTYDGELNGAAYFCSGIPPIEPHVTEEYHSLDGGSVALITTLKSVTVDSVQGTFERTFETYAVAHNITLKHNSKDEEIVEEQLSFGSFNRKATFNLADSTLVTE